MKLLNLALVALSVAANPNSYSNNVFILLSSSKFYFNYRHSINVLMMYKYLKDVGITDDQIILMIPSDHGCSAKNPFPGTIYNTLEHDHTWLCDNIEVDYKAEDLTEDTILNLLRGRYSDYFPASKRLKLNSESRIFIYFNGHGGENFFKIQDTELIHSEDLGKTFQEMYAKGMYKEVFFILDTCHASSLFDQLDAPNITMLSTARADESALAVDTDYDLNVFMSDKFSGLLNEFLHEPNGYRSNTNFRMSDFTRYFTFDKVLSHVDITTTGSRPLQDIKFSEFFPLDKLQDVIYGKGID